MIPDLPPLPPIESVATLELKRSSILPGVHKPPTAQCLAREAERNAIDPYVLLAVLKTENGRPGEVALNQNGTYDLGPMSINTIWLPTLAKRFGTTEPDIRHRLASDGCTNVAAAAWILKSKIVEGGGSVWEGVARFHSNDPKYHTPYLKKVYARFNAIVGRMMDKASISATP